MVSKETSIFQSSYSSLEGIYALENEISLLKKLNHENIVKYLGYSKTKETLSIFLEFVSGGSLSSIIEKYGNLSENLVKNYSKQILCGLEYLHWNGIIHGDLKPANILLNKDGVCKIADFGSCLFLKKPDSENFGSSAGTLNYSSPEILKGMEKTRASDIWSLGCVLYEMLSGKPPWHSISNHVFIVTKINAIELITKEKKGPPISDLKITRKLVTLFKGLFKYNSAKRLNVRKALEHAFFEEDFCLKPINLFNQFNELNSSPISLVNESLGLKSGEKLRIAKSPSNRQQQESSEKSSEERLVSSKKGTPHSKGISVFETLINENDEIGGIKKHSYNSQDRFDSQ